MPLPGEPAAANATAVAAATIASPPAAAALANAAPPSPRPRQTPSDPIEVAFGKASVKDDRLTQTATVQVMSYQEAGEL